jgi:hypothetical protein
MAVKKDISDVAPVWALVTRPGLPAAWPLVLFAKFPIIHYT